MKDLAEAAFEIKKKIQQIGGATPTYQPKIQQSRGYRGCTPYLPTENSTKQGL